MPIEVLREVIQPVQRPDILQPPKAFPGSRNISPIEEQAFNKLPRTLSLRRLGTNLVKNIAPYDISREPDRFRIRRRSPRAMCSECKRIYRIREGHPQCSVVKPGSGSTKTNKIFPMFSKKAA